MEINASLPVLSSTADVGSAALQSKVSGGAGEKTQIQQAVEPSNKSETDNGEGSGLANKEGRGRLIDIKV
jgi:hypothetical protein